MTSARPSRTASNTVRSSASTGSWATKAVRRFCCRCSVPSSGRSMPARILSRDDLPAPLRPIRPTRSPSCREKSAWSSNAKWPKASWASASVIRAMNYRGKALEVITAATAQQGHSPDTVGLAIVGSTGCWEGSLELNINGGRKEVQADPAMPLLWVLRDLLAMTGTKYGCGVAACGACTVRIDGQAVRSCVTTVGSVAGKKIQTIEGLAPARKAHPLQAAWIAEQVPQCGYCQSGMLMAAAALLEKKPKPTDADIDEAITNICRCGTYQRIKVAIKRAAGVKA